MRLWILAVVSCIAAGAAATERLPVVLTDADNLQDLPFFVALGAGYFRDEGFDLSLQVAPTPGEVSTLLHADSEQVAVLPPPIYLQLIADRFPLRIVANLLQNDPIDLVVRRSLAEARHWSPTSPLPDRLRALAGVRIGVAPGPVARLRALFRAYGLDADKLLVIVPLMGAEQNDAYAAGRVDALYAHTPFLERALVDQDALLYVNQSAGEVPALATRMIHAIVVTARMARKHPDTVRRIVRAIARAERLIHDDRSAAAAAVARALPDRPRPLVERLITLYQPAVPPTPVVTVAGLRSALALFPASKRAPDLDTVDLSAFVDDRFARAAHR